MDREDDVSSAILLAAVNAWWESELEMVSAIGVLGAVCIGIEETRERRVQQRHERRLYLTRPDLLPNPRGETPWQALYASQNDRAFITTMGFDTAAFHFILHSGFEALWNTTAIPRDDVRETAFPRVNRRSLDAAGGLGLVLHHLNSTMSDTGLVQIFALVPTTVTRYLQFSQAILLLTLRKTAQASIQWPSGDEFQDLNDLITPRHPLLTGAFGSIDGLKLPVQTSQNEELENATYNGWLHDHFISNILVFSSRGEIIACRINAPGSWHDSRVAQSIYTKLLEDTPEGWYLVADSAFPRGNSGIHGHIQAALKEGSRVSADPAEREQQLAFNRQLLSYRQTAEWGMRTMQGSFARLRMPLQIADKDHRGNLLEVCVRLFNLRTRLVGYNQIRSVYMPIWKADEQDRLWESFESMLFTDLRRQDRVSRFHLVVDDM